MSNADDTLMKMWWTFRFKFAKAKHSQRKLKRHVKRLERRVSRLHARQSKLEKEVDA